MGALFKVTVLFDNQYKENVQAFDYRYWCSTTDCFPCLSLFSIHGTTRELWAQIFATYIFRKRWLYKVVKTGSRCDIQWEIYDSRYTTRLITGLLCYMVYCSN